MNKFNPPTELPLFLGRKIEAPKPAPVTVVELKPFLFLDKLTGRLSYNPPTPPDKPTPTPAKPATRPDGLIVWHDEDPPEVGWYVATCDQKRPTDRARYWDNFVWSRYINVKALMDSPEKRTMIPAESDNDDDMVWSHKLDFRA